MEQKIPNICDDDIIRIINRDFGAYNLIDIKRSLEKYHSGGLGKNRVYASILKLSNGDAELINIYVDKANNDYRDVIFLAEYPNYSKVAFDDLSDDKMKELFEEDWLQYEEWLNRL